MLNTLIFYIITILNTYLINKKISIFCFHFYFLPKMKICDLLLNIEWNT